MSAHPELLPILVGNRTLPIWSLFMEVSRKSIQLSEGAEDFLFALRYCSGRERTMGATQLIECSWAVESAMRASADVLKQDLRTRFPDYNAEGILAEWLQALTMLRSEAAARDVVRWIAPMSPKELDEACERYAKLTKLLEAPHPPIAPD